MDIGGARSIGGVCARDVAVGGGSDVSVGGRCAYEAKNEANAMGGVCASEVDVDAEVDVEAALHVAHRGARLKARWRFDAIMTCNINEH